MVRPAAKTAAATTRNDAMLMRFRESDSASGVSRATLSRLARQLGYERESEVLHYAVRKLADEVLPKYELDDGPLTARQLSAIRKAAGPAGQGKLKSRLF
jgi:DNA-binding MurR/RpiR family transcriptional regulator